MRKLIEFIRSTYIAVLFILIEVIALNSYARSTAYTEARLLTRANRAVGGVQSLCAGVGRFFRLGRENRMLTARVAALEKQLARYAEAETEAELQRLLAEIGPSKYRTETAAVVGNTTNRLHNYITINRGRRDEVLIGMALTTPDGAIAGYVLDCSERYAVAASILNTSFRASGMLTEGGYYGSIRWDGRSPHYVLLEDLPKYAEPKVGDRVYTTGFEPYFPKGMLIGSVEELTPNEAQMTYTVRVRLAADLTALDNLVVIDNLDRDEIELLQSSEAIGDFEMQ